MAEKSGKNWLRWTSETFLTEASKKTSKKEPARTAEVLVYLGKNSDLPKEWKTFFGKGSQQTVRTFETAESAKVLVLPLWPAEQERDPRLKASTGTRIRDAVGQCIGELEKFDIRQAHFEFNLPEELLPSAFQGIEIALYRFKRVVRDEPPKLNLAFSHKGKKIPAHIIASASLLGSSVNLARHLVNLPPNILNPVAFAEFVENLFADTKGVDVEVWDEKRLKRENMNLHLSVGSGSATPPRLVHIRYRNGKAQPVAFVGKGITFDSGGLDIKPSSGMRLMKKDMGGAAALVGLAYWMAHSQSKGAADFYLALAENAIGGTSFRPGDVVASRNGMTVEIHNTDAEGRLVLADALDVAVTAKEKPKFIIDVATLTGAIKVALGTSLAGLFSNDNELSESLASASQKAGDPVWIMPLVQKYRSTFNTAFADIVNATDGFGGAITAALFLEKFAKDVAWAHLDIYAWKDGVEGAWREAGGSGQGVLGLAEWWSPVS